MPNDAHERARRLIEESAVEALSREDSDWLQVHTQGCPECAGYAQVSADVLHGWRSFSLDLDSGMNARMQAVVAAHARRKARRQWFAIATAAALLTVMPVYWHVTEKRESRRADELLLDRVEADVSRTVPVALEPLAGDKR